MSETTIGTCSLCGGPVRVPTFWWGVVPPDPTCAQCGAVKASHGPVIDMKHAPCQQSFTTQSANSINVGDWGLQKLGKFGGGQ